MSILVELGCLDLKNGGFYFAFHYQTCLTKLSPPKAEAIMRTSENAESESQHRKAICIEV